jgi:hypothetical protein
MWTLHIIKPDVADDHVPRLVWSVIVVQIHLLITTMPRTDSVRSTNWVANKYGTILFITITFNLLVAAHIKGMIMSVGQIVIRDR